MLCDPTYVVPCSTALLGFARFARLAWRFNARVTCVTCCSERVGLNKQLFCAVVTFDRSIADVITWAADNRDACFH